MGEMRAIESDDMMIGAIDIDNDVMDFADLGFKTHEEMVAWVQEGIDSLERDGGIPHSVVMAEADALLAKLAKR